jgi:acyl-CoA reductase-like NAD-dependent aldehyde dehydrogenase
LFIHPTIVWGPKKDSAMMQEEIFGPILPVFTYVSLDETIE